MRSNPTVGKALQDNSKIADEGTESDCPHSGTELIPITDSEQPKNNIVEEKRAKADTDESKVAQKNQQNLLRKKYQTQNLKDRKRALKKFILQ